MKFGFIAHPTSIGLKNHVKMADLIERSMSEQENGFESLRWQKRNLVPFMDFGRITGKSGASCEGILYYMPLLAEEMLTQPRIMSERVISGVEELSAQGAQIVGLGGFTGIVGNRGLKTLEKASVPVTTGNSLTAYATWRNLLNVLYNLGQKPEDVEIAVVGYPGSIALVLAKLFARNGCRLVLVYRGSAEYGREALSYLPGKFHAQIRLTNDITTCYDKVRFYVAATSSGNVIDPYRLLPGSVVVDAALPRDVMSYDSKRDDILIIDGGLISGDGQFQIGMSIMGLTPSKMINGCMAETIVLALENRAEAFSIGRELPEEKVLDIGALAEKHGLTTKRMASYGEKVDETDFWKIQRFYNKPTTSPIRSLDEWSAEEIRSEVLRLFGEHINPYYLDFYKLNSIDHVFVGGNGCELIDNNGRRFLDFVAGYGCLNMGHNHPRIVSEVKNYLDKGFPTFVQYISAPLHTSLLAEQLASIAPHGLKRVFFSNSGAEATEAAIKLARAAMTKPRFLYCDNGYHGKTLGALSVTGREKHRRAFEPLLPLCDSIPFGNADALQCELEKGNVGAFILEPIQGEGGVIIPPEGYLSKVQTLCREHDCILVIDEIQTGFGRTGKVFACEWEGIEPDIMIIAKSLSGGLVPIGATLSRKELWDRAYGSADSFVLHTSTFGGGNMASAAGLAALTVLKEEDLPGNAATVGVILKSALEEVGQRYPFIKEIRGRGLMIAIEFSNPFLGGVEAFAREFAGRIQGNVFETYRFLSNKARDYIRQAVNEVEKSLEEMFILRIVAKLSQDHNILTFVTANNSRVMRIQPPLILTESQANYFAESFAKVCEEMSTSLDSEHLHRL
jgi:acetylornithine/succinyldiaminopimelate/putrescine aminotransferase/predicted amino acid dehydrogenase